MANRLSLKPLLIAVAIGLVPAAHAQRAAGALGGASQALQDWGAAQGQHDGQRQLLIQQHELEMQRMRANHQMEMERINASRSVTQQTPAAGEIDPGVKDVGNAHPGWLTTVRTKSFSAWRALQPQSIIALGASNRPTDAILMLDLYKRDRPDWRSLP